MEGVLPETPLPLAFVQAGSVRLLAEIGAVLVVGQCQHISGQGGDGLPAWLRVLFSNEWPLWSVLGVYASIVLLATGLVWRRNVLLSHLRHDVVASLSKKAHRAAIARPPNWVADQQRSDLTYLISQDVARAGQGTQFLFTAVSRVNTV